jgi:hypothetical protein
MQKRWIPLKHFALSSTLVVAVAAWLTASQAPTTVHDSYAQARRLLDETIAAHGGLDELRKARQMRVTIGGFDVWRHQSRRVAPPYDREPYSATVHIDLGQGRLVNEQVRTYPGGAHNAFRFVTAEKHSLYVDLRRETYEAQDYPPAETQTGNLYILPQLVLLDAHSSGFALRRLGPIRLANGATVETLVTTTPQGSLTIGIDPPTRRLRALLNVRRDVAAGEAAIETEFVDYRSLNGIDMPTRRITRIAGEITQDYRYESVEADYRVPDALVHAPPGFAESKAASSEAVHTLAPGVWRIGPGTAVLAVAFRDHVMVIDAGGNAADTVARLAQLAPGKPLRYVVPTHHHDDHAGGVRVFSGAGATVVTTPKNTAFMKSLGATAVETLQGSRRVFSDADQTVELHDIGPGPHAEEMLVAWLPAVGILFQADLITASPSGDVSRGGNNETTLHFARWLKTKGWRVQRFVGAHPSVPDEASFNALVAQPLLPARP